jgi:hypothetical protein
LLCNTYSLASIAVDCGPPVAPDDGKINSYTLTTEDVNITFVCDDGFVPANPVPSVCTRESGWNPPPEAHICIGMKRKLVMHYAIRIGVMRA